GHAEYREVPQQPGNVVDQDVLPAAENQGWPDDRVGQLRADDYPLQSRLPSEIGERRILTGVRDADVDDPANAGFFGRLDQHLCIMDCSIEGGLSMCEAHPVSVVEGCNSLQTSYELGGVLKVERRNAHALPDPVSTGAMP